jgi:hypothetical protein
MSNTVRVAVRLDLYLDLPREQALNKEHIQDALFTLLDAVAGNDDLVAVANIPGAHLAPDWLFEDNIRLLA